MIIIGQHVQYKHHYITRTKKVKIIIGQYVQYKHHYITRTKNVKIIIGQHVQYKHHYIKPHAIICLLRSGQPDGDDGYRMFVMITSAWRYVTLFEQHLCQQLRCVQTITVLGTILRITYKLWNMDAIRDRMRFYVVVFVLYILSYYYLYVLSPCSGVRYNFRNKLCSVCL
jgi:hypothetical protein